MLNAVAAPLAGFLIGSFPTGLLVGRRLTGRDVRAQGSGSSGSTNLARLAGKRAAAAVAAVDLGKGSLAVAAGAAIGGDGLEIAAGVAAVVGHVWPVFAGWRGGKGVATSVGVLLALDPAWALIVTALFGTAALVTRTVSVGSLSAAALLPSSGLWLAAVRATGPAPEVLSASAILGSFLVFTHRGNLARILAGREPTWPARASG